MLVARLISFACNPGKRALVIPWTGKLPLPKIAVGICSDVVFQPLDQFLISSNPALKECFPCVQLSVSLICRVGLFWPRVKSKPCFIRLRSEPPCEDPNTAVDGIGYRT